MVNVYHFFVLLINFEFLVRIRSHIHVTFSDMVVRILAIAWHFSSLRFYGECTKNKRVREREMEKRINGWSKRKQKHVVCSFQRKDYEIFLDRFHSPFSLSPISHSEVILSLFFVPLYPSS